MFQYVIIDMDRMENVTEEQVRCEFDKDFFVNYFGEFKLSTDKDIFDMYAIKYYHGDIQKLVNFYTENQTTLCLPFKLRYRHEIGDAWTYFCIDFVNGNAQIGFQTPDQFLYEQLFLNFDLTPSRMQDAQRKMGIDKMQEIFEKIKKLRIPKKVIPDDLYQQYLICSNEKSHALKKSR